MATNQDRGARGEDEAVTYLEENGYVIIDRNVRLRRGELDLVAREGGDLVFVEVKARTSSAFGSPAEAVTPAKARKIAFAAQEYLYANLISNQSIRCDVVAIEMPKDAPVSVELYRNAIELGSCDSQPRV